MKNIFATIIFLCILFIFSSFKIADKHIEKIRNNPNLTYIIYHKYKDELNKIIPNVRNDELYIIFCNIASYSMAPYGECTVSSLDEMLKAPKLHCGKYGLLSIELAKCAIPSIEISVKVHAVTWNNGPFGLHQTLWIHRSHDDGIFMDPTTGIVALASFNEIAMGKKISIRNIFDFGFRKELAEFRKKVFLALVNGECKPSQILNYFKSPMQCEIYYKQHYKGEQWLPTPAANY